jgi:hypothetical protein
MSETKPKPTAQTVISLILPETAEVPHQGSILAKYESGDGKQSLAHLMPFSYSSLADIARAVAAAQQQLEALKRNPPEISVPTPAVTASVASSTDKAAKPTPQKSKKKKPSLDDFPEDDMNEVRPTKRETPLPAPAPQQPTALKVGDTVAIPDGTQDVDGESVSFSTGRIVEIDTSEAVPRVWVESVDGEEDVWLPLAVLTSRQMPTADELSAFEKPIGMGIPNKEGQLTLFG